jgi:hypothetical protein
VYTPVPRLRVRLQVRVKSSEVEVELGASRPGRSIPVETASNVHWIGDWMGLKPVRTLSCTDKCFISERIEPKFLGRLSRTDSTVGRVEGSRTQTRTTQVEGRARWRASLSSLAAGRSSEIAI